MQVRIVMAASEDAVVSCEKMEAADGFLKFYDASLNGSKKEEQVWVQTSTLKFIILKDVPPEKAKKAKKE